MSSNLVNDNNAEESSYAEQNFLDDDSSSSDEEMETEPTTQNKVEEDFAMLNDKRYMNSILVFGLFLILFVFVYIYGFHGILKFEKNLNYLIAMLFSLFGVILSIVLIMSTFKYLSDDTMSEDEKQRARNGMLTMIVLIIFFSMMAIIRYNYSKLFNALNKTLK